MRKSWANGATASVSRRASGQAVLLLTFLVAGCQSAPVEPFEAFSQSLLSLSEGSDKVLADLAPVTEARFKQELAELLDEASGGEDEDIDAAMAKLNSLRLALDIADPLAVKDPPLFLDIERMRIGAAQANAAFVQYGQLLHELASPETLPQSRFDELAKDLNGTAAAAATTLGIADSGTNAALFSTAAVAVAEAYLKNRQKGELKKAIETNQPAINAYAVHMQEAVDLIAKLNLNEYDLAFGRLQQQALAPATRGKAINELVALDRDYLRQIKSLTALRSAYGTLPSAHASLGRAVADSGQGLSAIVSLLESGKKLGAGYDRSLAANQSAVVQAEADKALAEADALAAKSEMASLKASSARFAADQARLNSDSTPDDADKQAHARALEEAATLAEAEAKAMVEAAKLLRKAAQDVQASADEIKRRLTAG